MIKGCVTEMGEYFEHNTKCHEKVSKNKLLSVESRNAPKVDNETEKQLLVSYMKKIIDLTSNDASSQSEILKRLHANGK